ncbi:universal stress protein [Telmatospirillum sp. J64-1]|uniref:universal stress protein n=1 Tax=Telmatospirillum sp. J64-1 TaxID=2502183 RepID=UPI00115F58F0|nr:universal stress protein [Telmatospirillum sp. J64-1]
MRIRILEGMDGSSDHPPKVGYDLCPGPRHDAFLSDAASRFRAGVLPQGGGESILMGIRSSNILMRRVFGGTTQDVVRSVRRPVFLIH